MDGTPSGVDDVHTTRIFVDGPPRFYYISDIHLELRSSPPENIISHIFGARVAQTHVKTSILLLAGDIGNPFDIAYEIFLKQCEKFFAHVIVVPGNHEYYTTDARSHTIRRTNRELSAVTNRTGAILLAAGDNYSAPLRVDVYSRDVSVSTDSGISTSDESPGRKDRGRADTVDAVNAVSTVDAVSAASTDVVGVVNAVTIDIRGIDLSDVAHYDRIYESRLVARIIGAALWTTVKAKGPSERMNDYRRILVDGWDDSIYCAKNRKRLLTPNDMNYMLHLPQKEFLRREIGIARREDIPVVVMTHHLPSYELLAETNDVSDCYASHSDELLTHPVVAWVCGHTHKSLVKNIGGVYCGINCYGYPQQSFVDTGFKARYFEIVDGAVIAQEL